MILKGKSKSSDQVMLKTLRNSLANKHSNLLHISAARVHVQLTPFYLDKDSDSSSHSCVVNLSLDKNKSNGKMRRPRLYWRKSSVRSGVCVRQEDAPCVITHEHMNSIQASSTRTTLISWRSLLKLPSSPWSREISSGILWILAQSPFFPYISVNIWYISTPSNKIIYVFIKIHYCSCISHLSREIQHILSNKSWYYTTKSSNKIIFHQIGDVPTGNGHDVNCQSLNS